MINDNYPTFKWVALLVELFIIVSITVSYLTIGAVLHHTCKYNGKELFIVVKLRLINVFLTTSFVLKILLAFYTCLYIQVL